MLMGFVPLDAGRVFVCFNNIRRMQHRNRRTKAKGIHLGGEHQARERKPSRPAHGAEDDFEEIGDRETDLQSFMSWPACFASTRPSLR